MSHPAVFLDRDGTVMEDRDHLADPGGVRLLPGAAHAISRLNAAGWPVIMVTNQSGIGRGYFTEAQYRRVQGQLEAMLAEAGAALSAVYYCPHDPEREPPCDCRKPLDGLFLRASREHGIDLPSSHYVGDRLRDIVPGVRFGGTAYLLRSPHNPEPSATSEIVIVDSLADAVDLILGRRPATEGEK